MKTLFANGCSWTWGGALEPWFDLTEDRNVNEAKRLSLVWPEHLKNMLGYDNCVNLAAGCGSNQRVLRTTYDWLMSQYKETLQNTLAVIQLTETSRYEYYHRDIESWMKCKVGVVIPDDEKPVNVDCLPLIDESNRRIALHTDEESMYSFLNTCHTLKSMFNSFGVDYFLWHYVSPPWHNAPEGYEHLDKEFNWVKGSVVSSDWRLWKETYTIGVVLGDGHPSVEGHIQTAEVIYDSIKDKL